MVCGKLKLCKTSLSKIYYQLQQIYLIFLWLNNILFKIGISLLKYMIYKNTFGGTKSNWTRVDFYI